MTINPATVTMWATIVMMLIVIAKLLWGLSGRLATMESKIDSFSGDFKDHLKDHAPSIRALSSTARERK